MLQRKTKYQESYTRPLTYPPQKQKRQKKQVLYLHKRFYLSLSFYARILNLSGVVLQCGKIKTILSVSVLYLYSKF